jgi:hypothetical protein
VATNLTWEQALRVFASSTDSGKIADRTKVNAASPNWGNLGTAAIYGPSVHGWPTGRGEDVLVPFSTDVRLDYTVRENGGYRDVTWSGPVYFAIGIWLNGEVFGAPASPEGNPGQNGQQSSALYDFMNQAGEILLSALSSEGNDRVSRASFDDAVSTWRDAHDWIADQVEKIKGRISTVDGYGDFSGETATAYKQTLHAIQQELTQLQYWMDPDGLKNAIDAVSTAIDQTVAWLNEMFVLWRLSDKSNARKVYWNALQDTIFDMSTTIAIDVDPSARTMSAKIQTRWGDPVTSQEFWHQVDSQAKTAWTDGLTSLDAIAADAMTKLEQDYHNLVNLMGKIQERLDNVQMQVENPDAKNPSNDGLNPNDIQSLFDKNNQNMQDLFSKNQGDLNDLAHITTSGLQDVADTNNKNLSDLFGNNNAHLQELGAGLGNSLNLLGDNFSTVGKGLDQLGTSLTSSSGPQNLLGADGKPILGADGNPLTGSLTPSENVLGPDGTPVLSSAGSPVRVPMGSTINSDGTVTDPKGELITSPDGQPLTVPRGSTLQSQGNFDPNNIFTGATGAPLVVPPGSTVISTGAVIGPDGKPVLGADGQPLMVPVSSTVSPTGTVIGPDGKPISRGVLVSEPLDLLGTGKGLPLGPGVSLTSGGVLPDASKLTAHGTVPSVSGISVGGGDGSPVNSGAGRSLGASVEADQAAFARTPSRLSMTAAEEAAAEEAAMLSRANVGASSPFIPPMTGGMGGAMGGPPQKRRTWLEEEEEVWGTGGATSVPGVIGRKEDHG